MNKISSILGFLVISSSRASAFGLGDIVNWTGTGTNQAAMLIDWQDGSIHPSMVWGFRWSGVASGEDMVKAILGADPNLTANIHSYSFGDAVIEYKYDGSRFGIESHDKNGFDPGTQGFWDYFNGNGQTVPTWTESGAGFAARSLSNNDWDGWSWAANFVTTPPSAQPIAAPVPEPIGACVLILSLPLLLARKSGKA